MIDFRHTAGLSFLAQEYASTVLEAFLPASYSNPTDFPFKETLPQQKRAMRASRGVAPDLGFLGYYTIVTGLETLNRFGFRYAPVLNHFKK